MVLLIQCTTYLSYKHIIRTYVRTYVCTYVHMYVHTCIKYIHAQMYVRTFGRGHKKLHVV